MIDFRSRSKTLAAVVLAVALVAVGACSETEVASGPACQPVDAAAFAAFPYKPSAKTAFAYGGATFQRALGNSSCEEVSNGGLGFSTHPVCDFTSPAVLEVKMDGGQQSYYTPGVGQPVRIIIRDGVAKCELPPKG